MIQSKGIVTNYLRSRILSGNDGTLQRRRDELEKKKKSFEDEKKSALHSLKVYLEDMESDIGKMERATDIQFKKDKGGYSADIDFTGNLQWCVTKMKEELEALSEKYQSIQHKENDIEE